MGVIQSCKPREEVLKGEISDAIFAADFGDLLAGVAAPVYKDPRTFFQNTHPAERLKAIVGRVFDRLADPKDVGGTVRLSTAFGGGKTHALMALWHLANHVEDHSLGTELLPAAGRPKKVRVVAVDAAKAGVPVFQSHDRIRVKSLWGEFFYQLGGKKALEELGATDDAEASPNEAMIRDILPPEPLLILLDELVIYMARLSDRGMGNVLGFLNSLSAIAASRPQTMLLVTDPAKQMAYATQVMALEQQLQQAADQLAEVQGRRVTDFDPIGKEVAQVITRRLFSSVDADESSRVSAQYFNLFGRVAAQADAHIPDRAKSPDYSKAITRSYPFHPRLLETAQDRLGAMPAFQRSRGVLRLFAKIIRSVWSRNLDVDLISAGEIDWEDHALEAELLARLDREPFRSAVNSDVLGHARDLDQGAANGIHQRVASALLLESLPLQGNSGLDAADLTLAVLRLDEAGHEPGEALDHLIGACWHTYPMESGRGFQFRYEANVLKQIEETISQVPPEDALSRVRAEVQGYFQGPHMQLSAWPEVPSSVQESARLQLVLCDSQDTAQKVCDYVDDRDPTSPMPRNFRNGILAVSAPAGALGEAVKRARRLMAAENIQKDHKAAEGSASVREQLRRIIPELKKRFQLQARRSFDRVHLAEGKAFSMEEQYQVSDETTLASPQGQAELLRFLEDKNLIYPAQSSLEENRFLKVVLSGATPRPEEEKVWTAKAVHERFLSAPGLRLVKDAGVVRRTLLNGVKSGALLLRLPDGRAYDREGMVGPEKGLRRRFQGASPPDPLPLDDQVLVALLDAPAAQDWLRVDEEGPTGEEGPKPPVPPLGKEPITVEGWENVISTAEARPLRRLTLAVVSPADARAVGGLFHPLGAREIALSVSAAGDAKGGGYFAFQAEDVKPTHPLKPLEIAQTVFNTLSEAAPYSASYSLGFSGEKDPSMPGKLRQLREGSPEETHIKGAFGPKDLEGE